MDHQAKWWAEAAEAAAAAAPAAATADTKLGEGSQQAPTCLLAA